MTNIGGMAREIVLRFQLVQVASYFWKNVSRSNYEYQKGIY